MLFAKSTRGLVFGNNRIVRTTELNPQSRNHNMFWFNGCSEVEVSGLKLEGEVLGKNIKLENMPKSNIKVTGSPKLTIE